MHYNTDLFGEGKAALVKSPYVEDYGLITHTPIDEFFLISELNSEQLLAETGENLKSEFSL